MDRFGASSSKYDIESLINKSKNINTEKSTNIWMNCYESWAKVRQAPSELSSLEPVELDKVN